MLDTDTKRRIDTARDILVGKVPDPKSQVEQITIALIYKFMDDMDAEAEELGGRRKFFTGNFARYGWAKLMSPGVGGHEMLGLYGEGITKMPENPGIPPLFREVFKNAYLPYRDPETLMAFLKIIDEFRYDHSERLGDAFEYLLSVLGSQGDAGQFRTPRHLIDFIVEIVDPKKTEIVLDPACGTAGFLISSYKHILKANADTNSNSTLTPDEKERLAQNIRGYDISPDMVRLSLVNLYLHGFTDPHIYEYDTLTSEERWNEFADVILANPPFMSPKGGIKPHKRFSIQAKRSEVLFVDYMAEHLTPTGRAGIIVPEGIIFQGQDAYRTLRKLLVENTLVAVISLPAGCFNPYSGVKTSVLILDKSLARQSDTIAFLKIENDGFSLGAQRRAIGKSDLPQVKAELGAYLHAVRGHHATANLKLTCGLIVPKEDIAADGDYNLSGERYRESGSHSMTYPWVKIESLVETITPPSKIQKSAFGKSGRFPIIDQSQENIAGWTDDEFALIRPSKPVVVFGDHTCAVKLMYTPFAQGADGIKILKTVDTLDPRYLYHLLRARPVESGGYQRHYSKLKEREIPLPPLEVQKHIVAEIEGYQKVIDGAHAVFDSYRPHIPMNPNWPMRDLGGLAENLDSRRVPITKGDRKEGPYPYYGASGIVDSVANYIYDEEILLISEDGANLLARSTPIAFSVSGKCWVNNHAHVLKFASRATQKFVEFYLNSISIADFVTGSAQPKLTQEALNRIPIPIPDDVAIQQSIIDEIETELKLVTANRELITRFEQKKQDTLVRVWGEEPLVASEV